MFNTSRLTNASRTTHAIRDRGQRLNHSQVITLP
nr:MAG TPA: hypothetical protein [Caudoviricetes sp.]